MLFLLRVYPGKTNNKFITSQSFLSSDVVPTSSKARDYCIRFGHSLWSAISCQRKVVNVALFLWGENCDNGAFWQYYIKRCVSQNYYRKLLWLLLIALCIRIVVMYDVCSSYSASLPSFIRSFHWCSSRQVGRHSFPFTTIARCREEV